MRARVIAVRIPRAPIKNAWTPASTFARAAAPHEFALIALRAFDAHGDRPRVLALRISGTTDELTKASVLLHQAIAAQRTLLIEQFIRFVRDARSLHQSTRGLAIGIPGARQKCAKAPALDGHFLAAVIAILGFAFATRIVAEFRRHVLDEIAIRIPRAAQEKSVPADALQ